MKRLIAPYVVCLGMLLAACGGGTVNARTATQRVANTTARTLVIVDRNAARAYVAAHNAAIATANSLAEYQEQMTEMNALERSLRTTHRALLMVQAIIDSIDRGHVEQWAEMIGCMVVALSDLNQAMLSAGLDVPTELSEALAVARQFGAGVCEGGLGGLDGGS